MASRHPQDEAFGEITLSDGQVWLKNVDALMEQMRVIGFSVFEGSAFGYVPGKGAVSLSDLVKQLPVGAVAVHAVGSAGTKRSAEVRAIRGEK